MSRSVPRVGVQVVSAPLYSAKLYGGKDGDNGVSVLTIASSSLKIMLFMDAFF